MAGAQAQARGAWHLLLILLVVGVGSTLTGCDSPTPIPTPTPGGDTPTPEEICITPGSTGSTPACEVPKMERLQVLLRPTRVELATRQETKEIGPGDWFVMLGYIVPWNKPGAQIEGVANIPQCCQGYLEFVQNVDSELLLFFEDRSVFGADSGWALDGKDPYDTWGLEDPLGENTPCTPGTSCTRLMFDSPSSPLNKINKWDSPLKSYLRNDKYRTYLLWRPLPGIRVALGVVEWQWGVQVSKSTDSAGRVTWELRDEILDPPAGQVKDGHSTSEMPVLSPTIGSVEIEMREGPH